MTESFLVRRLSRARAKSALAMLAACPLAVPAPASAAPSLASAPTSVPAPASARAGDVVETIEDSAQAPPSASAAAAKEATSTTEAIEPTSESVSVPAPATEKYTLSTWVREEAALTLLNPKEEVPYLAVPYDRAFSLTHAFARFRYARGHWFELNASSDIAYSYFVQGLAGSVDGDLTHNCSRGSFEGNVRELYLSFFTSSVDIRIGQQRVAWGRADSQSPNDVLNARDLRDPFDSEVELTQIPTPMARVDWDFGGGTLEGIWAPTFVPDRFDLYGTNWAIVQPGAPPGIRGFFHTMSTLVDPSLVNPFNRLVQQTRLPSVDAKNMSAGAKLATTLSAVDLDLYYYFGFDRVPVVKIDPAFADALSHTEFSRVTAADFGPVFSAIQAGEPPLTIEYVRSHHVGFDAGAVVGPIGLRLDTGYDTNRVFFRRDLTGVQSRAVQGTASIEYQTGDVRKVFLVEASFLRAFDAPADALLFVNDTTVSGALLVRYPLSSHLDAELRAGATLVPWSSLVLRPEVTWKPTDHVALSAGALWLNGSDYGFGGYYRRNTDAHLIAKYAF